MQEPRPFHADAPILEFDPAPEAVFEPRMPAPTAMPRRVVLCYFQDAIAAAARARDAAVVTSLRSEIGANPVHLIDDGGGLDPVALVHPGVGAPLAAGFLEELIALGGRAFVAVGGAGALVPNLPVGHVIVPTAAIRDEGTSYHYLPASREVAPTPAALEAIRGELDARGVPHVAGLTWTTDGLYRETRGKVDRRVAEGCVAVEMEAAACFAVAVFRGVAFGQLLYAGDDLSGETWDSRDWDAHPSRPALLELAIGAVRRIPLPDPPAPRATTTAAS
jgi:uridine phosphorylase